MKTKVIPFKVETALDIQKGKIEGKIVRNGHEVIILDFVSTRYLGYPIRIVYRDKDEVDYVNCEGLHIELPDYESQFQFKPFDRVLARDSDEETWIISLFSHMRNNWFVTDNGHTYEQCIPYEGHEDLVGTTKNPKED